jgi:type II secretory pathway component PulJ
VRYRNRVLRDESGFTLTEVLVTMMMMILVMFALYSIFDMSLRVFSFGNNKTEATENARLGLERMEREIRAAYPYSKTASPPDEKLFASWTADAITFGNDLNGNRRIIDPATGTPEPGEQITYRRGADPTTLQREADGSSQPVVEFVDGLSFEYLDRYGATATSEDNIFMVSITLTIKVDRGLGGPTTQTLTTDVALRNRVQ